MQIQEEKISWLNVLFFPLFFVALLWIIKYAEFVFDVDLGGFGVYPRKLQGIVGVITSPLIHGDAKHLFSNSIPLLVLGGGIFYFYKQVAYRVFAFIYLASGFWVWIFARESYHIGASGLVYGLATFIFFSGLIRKNKYLMAFSLFVVFVYGSLVWGVLPLEVGISWESHLMGAVAGIIAAIYYRKQGLQKETYEWENEEVAEELIDDEMKENSEEAKTNLDENRREEDSSTIKIIYHYKKEGDDNDEKNN